MENTRASHEAEGEGKTLVQAFIVVSSGKYRQSWKAGFRLVGLNVISHLWSVGTVPGFLAAGPEVIRLGNQGVSESNKEVIWGHGLWIGWFAYLLSRN